MTSTSPAPHTTSGTDWVIAPEHPGHPDAVAMLRPYLAEMISRYFQRPTDDREIDGHLAGGYGSDDLVAPTGLLFLARRGGAPAGCVGLRRLDPETTELTRMFVRPDARGTGLATALLAAAEQAARDLGATRMRLSTRSDLVEALALYARHGYTGIECYKADEVSDRWLEKPLA